MTHSDNILPEKELKLKILSRKLRYRKAKLTRATSILAEMSNQP